MKKYNSSIKSKFKIFKQMNFKQKINFILVISGFKYLINKTIYWLLSFFMRNKMSFLKRIIFDISKKKSEYVFFENREKFLLFTKDEVISKEYFINDNFEFEKFSKIINFLKKNYKIKKLYDIGANIGVICIPAVNRGLVQQAVAVEPEPENFKLLKLNILLNNLEDKIKTFNYALSSEDNKLLNLKISDDNSGGHRVLLSEKEQNKKYFEEGKIKTVKSKAFDNLFPNINSKEDLVWIDSQGFEANILTGANKLIESGAPVVAEFWPYGLKQNNSWDLMRKIIERYKFYCDISKDSIEIIDINQKNINKLFSDWDEEKTGKHSLFTDLLLLSNK